MVPAPRFHHPFHFERSLVNVRQAFTNCVMPGDVASTFTCQELSLARFVNVTPMGLKFGGRSGQYLWTESHAARLIRLRFDFTLVDLD